MEQDTALMLAEKERKKRRARYLVIYLYTLYVYIYLYIKRDAVRGRGGRSIGEREEREGERDR